MEDKHLLYAFEQFAMAALKGRKFPSEAKATQGLKEVRDLLIPVMRIDVLCACVAPFYEVVGVRALPASL
jgi:hypothetical protein